MPEVEWANMKAAEIRGLKEKGAIAVVPIGSTEQHGPHLPVQVDSLIVAEVAVRAVRFLKKSDRESLYHVRRTPEGHCECECKGFLRWGHCRHIRTARSAGMLDAVT